jgi:hypothetical protein
LDRSASRAHIPRVKLAVYTEVVVTKFGFKVPERKERAVSEHRDDTLLIVTILNLKTEPIGCHSARSRRVGIDQRKRRRDKDRRGKCRRVRRDSRGWS